MDRHEKFLKLTTLTQNRLQTEFLNLKLDTARATAALQGILYTQKNSDPPQTQVSPPDYSQYEEKIQNLENVNSQLQRQYEKAYNELTKTQQQLAKYKVMYAAIQFEEESKKADRRSPQQSPLPSPTAMSSLVVETATLNNTRTPSRSLTFGPPPVVSPRSEHETTVGNTSFIPPPPPHPPIVVQNVKTPSPSNSKH
eukprot:PhF_6_TR33813/c0_g1_i1/m.49586